MLKYMSINLGPADQLGAGESLTVDPETTGYDRAIAVFRDGDTLHAIDDTCTHLRASLANGSCRDGVITCWLHKATFSAATGEPIDYPARGRLTVHTVREEGGDLLLDVAESVYKEHDWE